MALYGSEVWTIWVKDKRRIEMFEMWCYHRMMMIRWYDHITDEVVLPTVCENILI